MELKLTRHAKNRNRKIQATVFEILDCIENPDSYYIQNDGREVAIKAVGNKLWFIRKRVEKMKITFKNKCNIPLFVIPTCSESFFKDMIYKERFPTSGNDASINGYTFNIINQSLSTKIRMKVNF
jgi:hypothetical protein